MKVCSKCKIEKPKSDYHPRPSKKIGVRSRCKLCEAEDRQGNEKQKAYRDARKDAKREFDKAYREANKDKIAESKKSEYQSKKPHYDSYRSKWAEANPERQSAISKTAKARRRLLEGDGIPTSVFMQWETSTVKDCYWCGKKKLKKYHVDHYHPLSKGGAHTVTNLVIACPSCNLKKSAKDPYLFAQSMGRLF